MKLERGSRADGLPCRVSERRLLRRGLFPVLLALLNSIQAYSAIAPGPDAFGYSAGITTAFTFTNITNGTHVLYFADDEPATVSIGFNFNFYSANYSTVSFNPNGLITFGGTSTDFNNVDLTTAIAPSNNLPCIAVLWDDWETEAFGADGLYYTTVGTPGDQQFIVQWNKVMPVNGTGTNTVTFQARLFEGSNQILLSYLDVVVSDDPGYGNGAFATVGIRDMNGQANNRNLLWSHNQAVITDGQNILFTRTNHAPIAAPVTAAALERSPVLINILANDRDPDGNVLTITAATPGANGSTTINYGRTITYHPNPGFIGTDGFDYVITDSLGGFATNTVTVKVWPFRAVSIANLGGDAISVHFVAMPSRSYYVETSSNLVDWTSVALRTADANGTFVFEQNLAEQPLALFFRAITVQPP